MRGIARIQTLLKLFKNVTSLCWQKRKQTIAMIEVYLANFNIFAKKCVNVNGSPWYETSKYLLAVLTNWEITSSASYYQVSKQYYGLQGSRVKHMLSAAQATYCGELYCSTWIICHIYIIFTIKLRVAYQ